MAEIDDVILGANVALNLYGGFLDYEAGKRETMFREEQANLNASLQFYENQRRTLLAEESTVALPRRSTLTLMLTLLLVPPAPPTIPPPA